MALSSLTRPDWWLALLAALAAVLGGTYWLAAHQAEAEAPAFAIAGLNALAVALAALLLVFRSPLSGGQRAALVVGLGLLAVVNVPAMLTVGYAFVAALVLMMLAALLARTR